MNLVDELEVRHRAEKGVPFDYDPEHDPEGLHQVVESGHYSYEWDDNGNLGSRRLMQGEISIDTDTFAHDWRDRLVGVDQGSTTTTLIVDPLGRLVAKVRETAEGAVRRVYLHDGDQVVAEYVQKAGGTDWQLERRHHWGRWIDDLAVERVDTDNDGELDETLWPVTDLLGSVQLLTDDAGRIVERMEYQTDGTPRFSGEDVTPPTATRVAWTGDGTRPTGDTVEAGVFEIGFDEWLADGSLGSVVSTLTPDGGETVDLVVSLDHDGRGVTLSGATIETGTNYALHLEGLTDRSGNDMWVFDLTFTAGNPDLYETLLDAASPSVLAVLDAPDGLLVLFDEPVVPLNGVDVADTITVERGSGAVAGSTERLGPQLFKWTAGEGAPWYPQQNYEITQLRVQDLAFSPNTVSAMPAGFAHIATFPDQALVAYSKPDHSAPMAKSRFGLTSLFQGRTWHEELGLYYIRARWYGPQISSFLERDPRPRTIEESLYSWLAFGSVNRIDPDGRQPRSQGGPGGFPELPEEEIPSDPFADLMERIFGPAVNKMRYFDRLEEALDRAAERYRLDYDPVEYVRRLASYASSMWTVWEDSSDPMGFIGDHLVSGLLDLAEEQGGTAGGSLEGVGVFSIVGTHGGINWQYFAPNPDSQLGLYTLAIFKFRSKRERSEYGGGKGGVPPLGALGVIRSGGLSLNTAIARPRSQNTPDFWAGFSHTVSASLPIPFPAPSGGSIFWNQTFTGVELSWGPGVGLAWTRPDFTPIVGEFRADRGTVEALARGELFRALSGNLSFERQ